MEDQDLNQLRQQRLSQMQSQYVSKISFFNLKIDDSENVRKQKKKNHQKTSRFHALAFS
jgi:predicted transcriptional regulator